MHRRAVLRGAGAAVALPFGGLPFGIKELEQVEGFERWWPELPYLTVEEDPVWSTSVDAVIQRWWGER